MNVSTLLLPGRLTRVNKPGLHRFRRPRTTRPRGPRTGDSVPTLGRSLSFEPHCGWLRARRAACPSTGRCSNWSSPTLESPSPGNALNVPGHRPAAAQRRFAASFASQFISGMGSMGATCGRALAALRAHAPNAQVGVLGLVQLVPVVVCGLLGGAVADRGPQGAADRGPRR